MFDNLVFNIPDEETITREAKIRFNQWKDSVKIDGRFIGVSLGAWLDRVEAAGVDCVPATKITSFKRDVWLRAEENSDEEFWYLFEKVCGNQAENTMIRIDPCSGISLKYAMSKGRGVPTSSDRKDIDPGDPRAYDIVYEFPSDEIDVWSRPWIDAEYLDEYPVEFRVFIKDNEVEAISNYYPQRALPDSNRMIGLVNECIGLSRKIVGYLNSQGQYPWMPNFEGKFESGKVSATLDFLITAEGLPLFLEAGPPYGAGAHPCAFIDHEVKGVAFAMAPGSILR